MPTLIFILILATLGIMFWPFVAIWSLNVLFDLKIHYNFLTWIAVWVLTFFIRGDVTKNTLK